VFLDKIIVILKFYVFVNLKNVKLKINSNEVNKNSKNIFHFRNTILHNYVIIKVKIFIIIFLKRSVFALFTN